MNNPTEGVTNLKKENFEEIGIYQKDISTDVVFNNRQDNSSLGISHWPKLLNYLKENVIFSFLFISILGYIIIAAFGGIEGWDDYIRYILFFIIVFLSYKILQKINFK